MQERVHKEEGVGREAIDHLVEQAKGLNLIEMRMLKGLLEKAMKEKRERVRDDLRLKISALAQEEGIAPEELMGRGKRSLEQPRRVRYRNPENADETWTGIGRRPDWIERELTGGKELKDFSVPDGEE